MTSTTQKKQATKPTPPIYGSFFDIRGGADYRWEPDHRGGTEPKLRCAKCKQGPRVGMQREQICAGVIEGCPRYGENGQGIAMSHTLKAWYLENGYEPPVNCPSHPNDPARALPTH